MFTRYLDRCHDLILLYFKTLLSLLLSSIGLSLIIRFFQELSGLRKTCYFRVIEETSGEVWELHLKPSKERSNLFGYLCKPAELRRKIEERSNTLARLRKIPLVLDLDDTLVRIVFSGDMSQRSVPLAQTAQVPHRVKVLRDGRRIVLAEKVHEFLDYISRYYDITICSLGDQPYVDMVVQVLDPFRSDPTRSTIKGIAYSARGEYLHIAQSSTPKMPPKDVKSLFPWTALSEADHLVRMDPIIVDDNVHMWQAEQRDSVIVARESKNAAIWNVNLVPIQNILMAIHTEFFKQADAFVTNADSVISPVTVYKELLRRDLSLRIADEVGSSFDGVVGSGSTQDQQAKTLIDSNGIPYVV